MSANTGPADGRRLPVPALINEKEDTEKSRNEDERTVKGRERIHIRGGKVEENYIKPISERRNYFKFEAPIKEKAAGLRPFLPLKAKTDYPSSETHPFPGEI